MKISLSGRKLIQRHSGLRMNAYQGRAGIWMIGYGSIRWANGVLVQEDDKLKDVNEADLLLTYSLQTPERIINTHINSRLTQNQYDALVSLVYDIKGKNFNESGIVELIQNGDVQKVPKVIYELSYLDICSRVAGSRTILEIKRRREAESDLFKLL